MLNELMLKNENVVKDLEPKEVFKYFSRLCSIPHGSGNTKIISNYLVDFAKKHNLQYRQDDANNIIIWKEATQGYENCLPVIIQGHMDMVCEKTDDICIDFKTEGLNLKTDGHFLWAEGTTLGGDDGIAVAYALTILAAEHIPHPALEVVITVDEEIGMLGAAAIELGNLKSTQLINIDSEDEGIFLTSCAGGMTLNAEIPMERMEKEVLVYQLNIDGLKGGHSGCEIDKERANANVIAGRVLFEINQKSPAMLICVSGGLKDNAIPRKSVMEIGIDAENAEKLEKIIRQIEKAIQNEYQSSDPDLYINMKRLDICKKEVLTEDSMKKLIFALINMPNGIQRMSMDVQGLVETSLNLGILKMEKNKAELTYSLRSSVESAKQYLASRSTEFIEFIGGKTSISGNYTGWQYKKESDLRSKFIKHYQELYHEEPKIEAIHAGLECGIFTDKIKNLDCISFGPDILSIHTVEEKLDIASTKRTWELLLSVLKDKNDK